MKPVVLGISHRNAPVAVRERFAVSAEELPEALARLRRQVSQAVLLSTCNRTELYTLLPAEGKAQDLLPLLQGLARPGPEEEADSFLAYQGEAAIRHLFQVAAGLDSLVLGEAEVLGQIRRAHVAAGAVGLSRGPLDRLFTHAVRVGRRVRTETELSRHAASVSSVSVGLARRLFGGLEGRRVLVIGAGEAGKLTALTLRERGVASVTVVSRTYQRAFHLAQSLQAGVRPWEEMQAALTEADVVISASGAPGIVLDAPLVAQAMAGRDGRPLLLLDIAVPRDIDPEAGRLPGVALYNIDALQEAAEANLNRRAGEAGKAEAIVETEVRRFWGWWHSLAVLPTIRELSQAAEALRRQEVQRALQELSDLSPEGRRTVERMSQALVKKLLHHPIRSLKETPQAEQDAATVRRLFRLPEGGADALA
jgi:glutamyl-tRNA reductase